LSTGPLDVTNIRRNQAVENLSRGAKTGAAQKRR
jgi:hypothetical protein